MAPFIFSLVEEEQGPFVSAPQKYHTLITHFFFLFPPFPLFFSFFFSVLSKLNIVFFFSFYPFFLFLPSTCFIYNYNNLTFFFLPSYFFFFFFFFFPFPFPFYRGLHLFSSLTLKLSNFGIIYKYKYIFLKNITGSISRGG